MKEPRITQTAAAHPFDGDTGRSGVTVVRIPTCRVSQQVTASLRLQANAVARAFLECAIFPSVTVHKSFQSKRSHMARLVVRGRMQPPQSRPTPPGLLISLTAA